jgi:hypothetical protein
MSYLPTRIQYHLGVLISHAMVKAMKEGASYDEVIETLHHSIGVIEQKRAFGVDRHREGPSQ